MEDINMVLPHENRASITEVNCEAKTLIKTFNPIQPNKRRKNNHNPKGMQRCSSLCCRIWEDLDPNILTRILQQVPSDDLCLNVSSVCQSWQAACWQILFWSHDILDLGAVIKTFDMLQPNKRRKNNHKGMQISSSLHCRRWEDLDPNILVQIFREVPPVNLLRNVSSVCRSWQEAFRILLKSRYVFDLRAAAVGFRNSNSSEMYVNSEVLHVHQQLGSFEKFHSPKKYNEMATKLVRFLQHIMEGYDFYGCSLVEWSLSIKTLMIPFDLPVSDRHLVYIAERSPGLEHLLLLGASKITVEGFAEAIQNWKCLKVVHVGPVSCRVPVSNPIHNQIIKEIGKTCQELEMLHIRDPKFDVNVSSALVIAESLPGLKKLGFEGPFLFRKGIFTLFQMCRRLEEISFFSCHVSTDCPILGFKDNQFGLKYSYQFGNFSLSWTTDSEGYAELHTKFESEKDVFWLIVLLGSPV